MVEVSRGMAVEVVTRRRGRRRVVKEVYIGFFVVEWKVDLRLVLLAWMGVLI